MNLLAGARHHGVPDKRHLRLDTSWSRVFGFKAEGYVRELSSQSEHSQGRIKRAWGLSSEPESETGLTLDIKGPG